MDILILDESPALAEVIEPLLMASGHRARAVSRMEALEADCAGFAFDACVVDLDHARAGRSPLLEQARLHGRAVRTVAWTASDGLWRATPEARRFDAFLAKPASFAMLLAALEGRACPVCALPIDLAHAHADCALGEA